MAQPNTTTTAALEGLLAAIQAGGDLSPEVPAVRRAYAALANEFELTPSEVEEYIADRNLSSRLAA